MIQSFEEKKKKKRGLESLPKSSHGPQNMSFISVHKHHKRQVGTIFHVAALRVLPKVHQQALCNAMVQLF